MLLKNQNFDAEISRKQGISNDFEKIVGAPSFFQTPFGFICDSE
jgi:hypothetical protein